MAKFHNAFANNAAFIAYVTAGHGGLDYTVQAVEALAAGGVDIVELGMPFSDPVADGPVIQQAMQTALEHDITLDDIFEVANKINVDIPIVLFSYYNPIFQYGQQRFYQAGFTGTRGGR